MGHGRGPHAVEIKTSDGQMVDVYKECALSCTHPDSKLTQKPKTIIVQACRGTDCIIVVISNDIGRDECLICR